MRGRRPKRLALKVRQGNPGKRKLNRKEPRVDPKIPRCPEHLSAIARQEWKRITDLLGGLGVITELDRSLLTAYCAAWADYVAADEALSKSSAVLKAKHGAGYLNPLVGVRRRAMDAVVKYGAELGLTPASRARLQVQDMETRDELEARLFPHGRNQRGG